MIIDKISKIGIVPVIALDNVEDAKPLAKALCDGGLKCAEVTFRTDAAEEAIRVISKEFPDMLLGAGTVLTTEQVDKAIDAGAKFIVSPGLNPKVVKYCIEKNITILPGTASPSDVEAALELGLNVVKFFPAEQAGGINMIKAMSAPYTKVKFMPTGGINASNLKDYLDFDKIVACGGSWMVKKDLIKEKDFNKIRELTKEAVNTMLGFELRHIGINTNNEKEATLTADIFAKLLGAKKIDSKISIFTGEVVEVMKEKYFGTNGHIAIATNYIERAMYHLESKGFEFNKESASYDNNGKLKVIYLKNEIGGFALHLVQK